MSIDTPVITVKPSKGWISLKLKDLWEYRDLFYFLTWRDIKVRYKQTVLGAAWAIIQPFFTMVVFSLFFGKLAKVPSDGNHTYEFAKRDFENCDRFLERGGLILFDDSADGSERGVCQVVQEVLETNRYDLVTKNPNYFFKKK